jgi:hypothetical protein
MLLMTALNFTAADLADNRRGRLSRHQRDTLLWQIWLALRVWGGAAGTLVIVGLLSHMMGIVWFAGAMLAAVVTLAVLSFQADLNGGIRAVDGRVTLESRLPLLFWSPYCLIVGQHRFPVSRQTGHGFTNGNNYRVYYTSRSRTIISGEVLR